MGELIIRRNRGLAAPQYQGTDRVGKHTSAASSEKAVPKTGLTVSETLRQLMTKVSQAENHTRESRRALQTGESVLDEVQDSLDRIAGLAQESANGEAPDRAALQAELDQLREDIDRMIRGAMAGEVPLFLDDSGEEGAGSLLYAVVAEATPDQGGVQTLPSWLMNAFTQDIPSPEQLLASLGLDKTASGSELLAAVTGSSLEGSAGYLAALYLGAVIAGAANGEVDPTQALDGLQQLLEKMAEGVPLDRAIELLTEGRFTSLADFQTQFTSGTAPELQKFLTQLLLSGDGPSLPEGSPLLTLLPGLGELPLELSMELLTALSAAEAPLSQGAANGPEGNTQPDAAPQSALTAQFGSVQASGQDLSGVSFDPTTGVLTLNGTADITLQGIGQRAQALLLSGAGTVTLQNVNISVLTVDVGTARLICTEKSLLGEVFLKDGTALTLGGGPLKIGLFHTGPSSLLRLIDGTAAIVERIENTPGFTALPVVLEGPASLAARAVAVQDTKGNAMEPFDLVWKTLLPGWSSITSMELDGRQAKLSLLNGDPARLWLQKGDPSHGYPAHSLILRGKDPSGQPRTRYAYLHWNQQAAAFQEVSMYPNPFTVTGGEAGLDWLYEEESQTLHILTDRVSSISGGPGTDTNQNPFSGRIALADRTGPMRLALDGVVCRVDEGRAFDLGQENSVTLLLRSGTNNLFESGAGCSGISLGDGTTLCIDCQPPPDGGSPDGILTATGGAGSAGIGWDSGAEGQDCTGHILIRGGAGFGMGKHGFAGSVTIIGGMTTSVGGQGNGINMGISLQMGEDTVTLPQFRLSSRTLRLDRLSLMTREYAQSALATVEADRRWVSRIQEAYSALYSQLEQSSGALHSVHQHSDGTQGPVRDTGAAGIFLDGIRRSILLQPTQAIRTHGKRGTEDVGQLLQ